MQESTKPSGGSLGTFAGVFTPSILTILGIILFRRLGYVVGSVGLFQTLLIITLSSVISILTSVSLSAIATNLKVRGGGSYYLISRTLGAEFGGAIGIVLFLAQSVSIAFYCIGFAETVSGLWTETHSPVLTQLIAVGAVFFLLVFAWLGTDWATRLQFVVMTILAAALLSFFAGGYIAHEPMLLKQNWPPPAAVADFWVLFAIFFPAVTGFTQGVSMSGDLKDPGRSIQVGTFTAVGISIAIYLGAALVLAATLPADVLTGDYGAMRQVSVIGWLVEAGVIAATLSSAMAFFLGAPRILQSIARDRIFPILLPLAQGAGPTDNPRRAVLLAATIALVTIGLGQLNLIALVVSMFFLTSYGLLNYATYYEARAASPWFRPRFRLFNKHLSLLGAIVCIFAMFAIDPWSSAIALAILFAVHQYLRRTAGPARWADSRRSYHMQLIRENLLAISDEPEHPRDWRPCILAFCDDRSGRARLLSFASWIEGGSGFTTAVQVVAGEGQKGLQLRDKTERELLDTIEKDRLGVFARVLVAPEFGGGVESLLQSFGIGVIRANMVLLNSVEQIRGAEDNQGQVRYGLQLQEALRLGCNVVVLDARNDEWARLESLESWERRIDVWWWGDKTSQLMLLLAYLMTRTDSWSGAKIRVLAPTSEEGREKTLEKIQETLEDVRIAAELEEVLNVDPDVVVENSSSAAMVFLPLHFRESQLFHPSKVKLDALLGRLPVVALVLAGRDIDIGSEPDEGEVAERTAAVDTVKDTEMETRAAEEEAAKLAEAVKHRSMKLKEAEGSSSEEKINKARSALRDAEKLAAEARKKLQEARAKAQEALRVAKTLGIKPEAPQDEKP